MEVPNYTITGTTGALRIENQNGQAQLINVYSGTLTVDAIVGSGTSPVVKSGEGTLVLKKDNAYGSLRVYQGVVRLDHNNALENTSTVQSGAAIELSNGISIGAFASTITGTGISDGGALRSVATTTSSFAGAITLGTGGARINSDSTGTLTLTGGIVTAGNNVTFGGAGNTNVSTAAISGSGGLIKDGAGTTTLSATNTYTGPTAINAGTLVITGATQSTSAITFGGGVLGLDTATPVTAASATVDFTGQSVLVTGPTVAPSYLLLTASSITGTPALAVAVPGYTLQVVSNELRLVQTSGDVTPPTLTSIADDASGGTVAVNTPVTCTVTFNEDMNDATVTAADFSNAGTSTMSFGTITETSPGVFSVTVTPTTAGTLILQIPVGASLADVAGNLLDNNPALVDDTTITVQTQYEDWAEGAPFGDDSNNDGVSNGMAFLLGASSPTSAVTPPTVTQNDGDLILNFNCLPDAARGSATLWVEHSSDLGGVDLWTATTNEVPDATNAVPDNDVTFVVSAGPAGPPALNSVTATIDSAAAAGGKLFVRLKAVETP